MLWRNGHGEIPDFQSEQHIIAVASDQSVTLNGIPWLDINQPVMVAEFIRHWLAAGK